MKVVTDERRQRGIQSVEVGGALLAALSQADAPLSLSELARAAGLPAAKAHPYLVSYGHLGLIVQDRATGHYDFGPLALHIGLGALRRLNPLRLAAAGLSDLVAATGHTAAVAVWGNYGATVVNIVESTRPLHVNLRVGSVMSLLNTATGKVFAAYLSDTLIDPALKREGQKESPTIGAGIPVAEPRVSASRSVRERGMARTVNTPLPGISAFSAPVFDHRGELAMVITLLGPTGTFDTDWQGEVARALKAFTETLSHQLGGTTGGTTSA